MPEVFFSSKYFAVRTRRVGGLTAALALPADQDFHGTYPWQARAVLASNKVCVPAAAFGSLSLGVARIRKEAQHLSAPPNDKRIVNEGYDIAQNHIRHPSLKIAGPITGGALSFIGLLTAMAAPAD